MALEAANLMAFKAASLYRGQALRRRGECRQIPWRRSLLRRLPAGGDDLRRLRLRARVPRRALPARILRRAHRAGEPPAHPLLHRRARARAAEILLMSAIVVEFVLVRQPIRSSAFPSACCWS